MKKISDQLNTIIELKQSVVSLDRRLEETEHRCASLRFKSVKLPTKLNGQIIYIKPIKVETDTSHMT